MDYDNPQFIAAVKKILRSEDDKPSVEPEDDPNIHRELPNARVDISATSIDQIKANSPQERRHDWWKDFFEVAGIGVVTLYTMFAYFQWDSLNTANLNQSAANISSGATADRSLGQIQQTVKDTHILAEQAGIQAKAAKDAVRLATTEAAKNSVRVERQLKLLQDQAKAAHDQADAALRSAIAIQQQTEISERPWLSIESKPVWLNWVDNPTGKQPVLVLRLSIKNVGKSIAKDVQIDVKMFPTDVGMPVALDAMKNQQELCDHPTPAQIGRFDLFPIDEPAKREMDVSTVPATIEAHTATSAGDKPRKVVGFYIVGCASYHFSFGAQMHQTLFAYHLLGPPIITADGNPLILSNGMPLIMGAFEIGVAVKEDQLGMMQELFARNDAY